MSKFTSLKALNFKVDGYPGKKGLRHLALNKALELGLSGYLNYTPDSSALFIHIEGNERSVRLFADFISAFTVENDLICNFFDSIELNCTGFTLVHDPESYIPNAAKQVARPVQFEQDLPNEPGEIEMMLPGKLFAAISSGYEAIRRGLKHTGLF